MGSKVLASQVKACSEKLQALASGRLRSLRLDEGTVELVVVDAKGRQVKVSMICEDVSAYPDTPALLFADQEGALPDGIADQFSSGASLQDVITQVCQAMRVPLDEAALQSAISSAATAANGTGSNAGTGDGAAPMSESGDEPSSDDVASDAMSEGSDGYGSGGEAASGSDGEYDDDDDDNDANSDDEDREMLMECGQRQGRWERHEAELEAAEAARSQALSMDQAAASKNQIFSPKEAFSMLSKEVLDVFRQQDPTMYVDAHGDDVYTWNVWIGGFQPDSTIARDMLEVSRRFSQSTVHLRFSFKRGLHPFYPPAVEIIRPHLKAPMPGAVASHPMLKLQNWDPWRRNVDVFKVLKDFLEAHGQVDVNHVRNSEAAYPDSAYSPLERGLARLEALTDAVPACWGACREVYDGRDSYDRNQASLAALQQSTKKRSRSEDEKKAGTSAAAAGAASTAAAPAATAAAAAGVPATAAAPAAAGAAGGAAAEAAKPKAAALYWAQGTGYGHGAKSGPVWDPKAAAAAQEAQDAELQAVLSGMVTALAQELGGSVVEGAEAAFSGASAADAAAQRRASGAGASDSSEGQLASVVSAVADSALLPFLVQQLCKASFSEVSSRSHFYTALLKLVQELCRPATQALLVQEQGADGYSVAGAMRAMTSSAKVYGDMVRKTLHQQGGSAGASTSSAAAAAGPSPAEEAMNDARRGLELADLVLDISRRLDSLLGAAGAGTRGASGSGSGRASGSGQMDYITAMKSQLFHHVPISKGHHYLAGSTREAGGNLKPRTVRVAKEIAGLEKDLAGMTEASIILVRVDESNAFLWKALITGPEDTPYCGGCFIFDIYFPTSYPSVALQCNLCTTGGGTIRFNPNLYNCGKVCLSLLGTWSGGQGEGWDPSCSTAKQVLVSIQSLILVPNPYFNEPGFERSMHTEQGKKASRDYDKVIKEGTIARAMVDHLLKPPAEFKEAIELHFKLRGDYILDNIQKWVDDAKTWDSGHANRLKALRKQLAELIGKLK